MFTINGFEANYNNLYIYNGEEILYSTCRPYNMDIEIDDIEIRSARKLIFDKKDCFEIKTPTNEGRMFTNGKDLYIHTSVISIESVNEVIALKYYGETDYKKKYKLKLHCNAYRWNIHREKVNDLEKGVPLYEYDPNGIWSDSYSKKNSTYSISIRDGVSQVYKSWQTHDKITEIEIESDYYTRTEKTEQRLYEEEIAKIMSECSGGNLSHYDVRRMLEKLEINIRK